MINQINLSCQPFSFSSLVFLFSKPIFMIPATDRVSHDNDHSSQSSELLVKSEVAIRDKGVSKCFMLKGLDVVFQ